MQHTSVVRRPDWLRRRSPRPQGVGGTRWLGRRPWYVWLLAAVLVVALAIWVWGRKPTQSLRATVVPSTAPAAATLQEAGGFTRAEGPRAMIFPQDHGPHDDYQTEWWYYTGNLTAETGEHFGYQLTFFRRALLPTDQRTPRQSTWGTEQVYMAHFAVTDVAGGQHLFFERFSRGAADLAGAQAEPYRVWLEDWSVVQAPSPASSSQARSARQVPGSGEFHVVLRAAAEDVALELTLQDLKGPILQGNGGYSRKGPEEGNASYYYSLTQLATDGKVAIKGKTFAAAGLSWMDHEFSTSALGPELAGWDWFSVQLNDGTELMLYALRRSDGSQDPFSSGTVIAADGAARTLGRDDFVIQPTGRWRSPHTGALYPAGWIVTVPSADLRLTISPHLADQEMVVSYAYWEGAVKVNGTAGGHPVAGHGYVELTGHATSLQGQF